MRKKSTLLNEVIADAKAVKHTAEQAAMSALREAFQPTINRLVSQKLAEEGDLEDEEPVDAPEPEIDLDAPVDEPAPEAPVDAPAPVEDDEEEVDLDEILRELEGDETEDDMGLEEMDDEENPDLFTEEDDEMYEEDDMLDDTLDEIINEVEDEMEEPTEPAPTNEVKRLRSALKRAKLQLKEAHLAIATQKSALTEVNILNTKLTYATKLLKTYQLDEAKQTKVLKAFDRAKTIREVKLVYSVLVESFNKIKANKLTESVNRKPQAVNPQPSNQYSYAPRWQVIAGIKK